MGSARASLRYRARYAGEGLAFDPASWTLVDEAGPKPGPFLLPWPMMETHHGLISNTLIIFGRRRRGLHPGPPPWPSPMAPNEDRVVPHKVAVDEGGDIKQPRTVGRVRQQAGHHQGCALY